jgi:8-oxo-dGTP diphosphatase
MIEVVCAVIEDKEKGILACQRPAGKHLAGLWEFPGGKVEEKESPALALIREIREELEVEISVLSELEPVEWQYPHDWGTDNIYHLLMNNCPQLIEN